MKTPQLFLVHCGYYDSEIAEGIYEFHTNFIIVAESFEDARAKIKLEPSFQRKKMHVDGLQHIEAVKGYRIELRHDPSLEGTSQMYSNRHRELVQNSSNP